MPPTCALACGSALLQLVYTLRHLSPRTSYPQWGPPWICVLSPVQADGTLFSFLPPPQFASPASPSTGSVVGSTPTLLAGSRPCYAGSNSSLLTLRSHASRTRGCALTGTSLRGGSHYQIAYGAWLVPATYRCTLPPVHTSLPQLTV